MPRPVKVLLLTGETQGANLQNILRRVCLAKELAIHATSDRVTIDGIDDRLVIKEALPALDDDDQLAVLGQILEASEGARRVHPRSALFRPGVHRPLPPHGGRYRRCQRRQGLYRGRHHAGLRARHMSKDGSRAAQRGGTGSRCRLADLNGRSFGPAAGSRLLVNYLQPYDPTTGCCTLWLNVGGRAGHGGLYSVAIDEATFQKNVPLNGRHWKVEDQGGQRLAVQTAEDLKAKEQESSSRTPRPGKRRSRTGSSWTRSDSG